MWVMSELEDSENGKDSKQSLPRKICIKGKNKAGGGKFLKLEKNGKNEKIVLSHIKLRLPGRPKVKMYIR